MIFMPAALQAQLIRGVVTSSDPSHPVDSAEVIVINLADATEYPAVFANSRGEFGVAVSDSGHHALWVRRIGYRPHLAVLTVGSSDTLSIDVTLDEFVVDLEGVTVYGIAAVTEGQREFWTRRNLAWNSSADYTEIEQLHQGKVSDVVQVLPLSLHCNPLVYVDGFRRRFMDDLPLDWVYGIEVYRGYYNIPHRYRDPFEPAARCGAVLLWTKVPR